MYDANCAYCAEGALVDAFGIKICELETSKVYLFKEQSHKGRVIVAHKKHVSEMVELIEVSRNYETNQKVIQTIDNTLEIAANQLGKI